MTPVAFLWCLFAGAIPLPLPDGVRLPFPCPVWCAEMNDDSGVGNSVDVNSAGSSGDLAGANGSANPLFQVSRLPFRAPPFDRIRDEHYLPAFEAGMQQQIAEIGLIAALPGIPTFTDTLEAMEHSGEMLNRVRNVFFSMTAAHTNPTLQDIQATMAPRLAAHSDDIRLNRLLFQRVQHLWEKRQESGLNEDQQRVLKEQYEEFVRAGALLNESQQVRVRAINAELSSLMTKFQDNLLAVTKERSVIVDDVAQLAGMPPDEMAAAAEAAAERGQPGKYLLPITNTTRQPVLPSLRNRALRQRVWEASAFRAVGRDGGIDNRPLVLQIAKLRAERAEILGFTSHAAYQLQPQMAKDPVAARTMLTSLIPALRRRTDEEEQEIRAVMREEGAASELLPWDWEYYAEKVRRAKFDVDENLVRPYFELNNVLQNGVFYTMHRLYGIEFRERTDLPVYHPEVRVFDVIDRDGTQLGLFYADYLQRDSKRGGAWMGSYVDQSRLLGEFPVVVNVMNIPRPPAGETALISFDNVTTMFHEMGHALHGLLSSVTYPSVSGTSVPRDFVEFPSTFEEDWAIQPEVLSNYARHYQTGEVIPRDLLDRLIRARRFNQGFDTLEYVAAALLDLEWHALTPAQIPTDVEAFESQALARCGVDHPAIPARYKSSFFAHIWSGGYSASYYAYMWSEVLAADAFAHMMAQGGLTRENGQAFRDAILSRGGSREPMSLYTDFRGQPPTVDALLIRRGLRH